MKSVLVASRNDSACHIIRNSMRSEYNVEITGSKDSCLEKFRHKRYEFLFIDVQLLRETHQSDYKTALQPYWQAYPSASIIVISSQEMIREAVEAVKAGASNYLTYPVTPEEVQYVTQSLYKSMLTASELDYLRDRFWEQDSLEIVYTNNPLMKTVFNKVRAVAPTKSTVLLIGETGTGKGVLARLIHRHSNRRDGPFISVHCGAIPDTLLESELFGHEKGAFTGALRRKLGKFEIAHGGTIFLDEIGTITPSAQVKLLEVLQDGTFNRLGGDAPIETNVRVIAATNTDLLKMCEDSLFRKDLYYRLDVFPIEIPPLRERPEDMDHIIEVILKRLNKFNPNQIHDVHPDVIEALKDYAWPGNIRELENLLERACILESSSVLCTESFPGELFSTGALPNIRPDISLSLAEARRKGIEALERLYLQELLKQNRGKIKESADIACVSPRQLHKLLTKYGIKKEAYKNPSG
jgi:DNA-binding NtrC family response regulator